MLPAENRSQNHRIWRTAIICCLEICNFQRMCENNESFHAIGLLSTITLVRLTSYVDGVTNTTNKLSGTISDIAKDWIGAIIFTISYIGCTCCGKKQRSIECNYHKDGNNSKIDDSKIGSYQANWMFTIVVGVVTWKCIFVSQWLKCRSLENIFLENVNESNSGFIQPKDKFALVRDTEVFI